MRMGSLMNKENRVSFWIDKNVPKLDSGHGGTTLYIVKSVVHFEF